MFKNLKIFFHFFSRKYLKKIGESSLSIKSGSLKQVVSLVQSYLPRYSREHWHRYEDLLSDFKDSFPYRIKEADLPQELLGVFIPDNQKSVKGRILLNPKSDKGMFLSTLAHEKGHLFSYLYRLFKEGDSFKSQARAIYARSSDLTETLTDPEELLADMMASLGAYPKEYFQKSFCNKQGELYWVYRWFPTLLFSRAILYMFKNYTEMSKNFFHSKNKLFHLCLGVHFIRLRVFIYGKYKL